MSWFRPSCAEERWLAVGADSRTGGWRDVRFVARCGLFVLGTLACGLFAGLIEVMHVQTGRWLACGLLLAAAEVLIMSRRVFFGGFAEAMELVATAWLIMVLSGVETYFALGLLGAAIGIVGLRLLNPLFTTAGVTTCMGASAMAWRSAPIADCACYAIAAVALAVSVRTFQRPSYDRMLGWLVVAMPVAASAISNHPVLVLILSGALGIASLAVGMAQRMHPPLLAFLVCTVCVANEARKFGRLPLEVRLIIGGSLALLAAIAVDRYLRKGRRGITSRALGSESLSVVLVAALPVQGGASGDRFQGGGGTFSGGGASGKF